MKLNKTTQRGAALFVGLIFLLVLTILGLTAARVSTLDERMAGNFLRTRTAAMTADNRVNAAVTYVSESVDDPAVAIPALTQLVSFNQHDCASANAGIVSGCDGELWWQSKASDLPLGSISIPAEIHTVIERIGVSTGQSSLEQGDDSPEDYFRITSVSNDDATTERSVGVIRQMIFVP